MSGLNRRDQLRIAAIAVAVFGVVMISAGARAARFEASALVALTEVVPVGELDAERAAVVDRLTVDDDREFANVSFALPASTSSIVVTGSAGSGADAASLANEFAAEIVRLDAAARVGAVEAQLIDLGAELEALRADRSRLQEQIATLAVEEADLEVALVDLAGASRTAAEVSLDRTMQARKSVREQRDDLADQEKGVRERFLENEHELRMLQSPYVVAAVAPNHPAGSDGWMRALLAGLGTALLAAVCLALIRSGRPSP